jgi:hypothetical protein
MKMADTQESRQSDPSTEGNGNNGSDARKTVARAAAIAAASGATALAAKKAFGDRESSGRGEGQRASGGSRSRDDSVVTSMVSSAWDSARDSLVPMIEDAAESAGEYLARSAPDLVRESIVPRFIRGFENAQGSAED